MGPVVEVTPCSRPAAPTGLTVDAVRDTELDFSWTDAADNEDGFYVDRRKRYADGFGSWRRQADLTSGTTTYTDSSVQPARTHQFRILAFTEHAEAGDSAQVTTDGPGDVAQTRVPSQGWYVEVDHPDRALPLTAQVLKDPEIQQRINGQPTVRIPVPKDDIWQREAFTDAPMRVWKDGTRQPIEELQRVEPEQDRTVLVGVGGVELERRLQDQVDQTPVDDYVRSQIPAVTSYAAIVDDPAADVTGDKLLQSTAFKAFDALIQDALGDTDPIGVQGGSLQPLRSSWMATVGNGDLEGGYTPVQDFSSNAPNYIDGEAARLDGATATLALQASEGPSYTIPGSRVGIAYHNESLSGSGGVGDLLLTLDVDGTTVTADDVAGGERVASGGTVYERRVDYDIDYINGELTTLSSGGITDGESLTVRYRWKPAFSASVAGGGSRQQTVQLPGLVTGRGCGIAARRIAQAIDAPLREATVTLPRGEDWLLVNSIDPAGVPTDGALDVRDVETAVDQQVLTLGSRETFSEIVADIQSKLSKTAKRT